MEIALKNQGLITASTTFDFLQKKEKSANPLSNFPPLLADQIATELFSERMELSLREKKEKVLSRCNSSIIFVAAAVFLYFVVMLDVNKPSIECYKSQQKSERKRAIQALSFTKDWIVPHSQFLWL